MSNTSPQELGAFFSYVVDVLESIDIPYMVAGGFAAIFYGEPRLTKNTFTAIIADVREASIKSGLLDETTFDEGIQALYRTTQADRGFLLYVFQGDCHQAIGGHHVSFGFRNAQVNYSKKMVIWGK